MRKISALFLFATIISYGLYQFFPESFVMRASRAAATFFVQSSTTTSLQSSYKAAEEGRKPFTVLIVPGHDNVAWGTDFQGVKEADMNLELSEKLSAFFGNHPEMKVLKLRDRNGYNPDFIAYKNANLPIIQEYVASQKRTMQALVHGGLIETDQPVFHSNAPLDVVWVLYAANSWANAIRADLILHIHFNDHPRKNRSSPGKYTGFTIYVPDEQYSNYEGSRAVAEKVKQALSEFYSISNFPGESAGIVPDHELIALGSFNTLDSAALLMEYGYIYESQFLDATIRSKVINDLAFQTYRGVMSFFGIEHNNLGYSTTLLPHTWNVDLKKGMKDSTDVLALQRALQMDRFYPPTGKTLEDCPPTGTFGPCTVSALKAFQQEFGLSGDGTHVGSATRTLLNKRFSF